jgi:hypothetical protein
MRKFFGQANTVVRINRRCGFGLTLDRRPEGSAPPAASIVRGLEDDAGLFEPWSNVRPRRPASLVVALELSNEAGRFHTSSWASISLVQMWSDGLPKGTPFRKMQRGHPILTPKESKFLKAFVKSGSQRLSALSAGYSPTNPDQSANCVMKQLRRKVPDLLEHVGLHLEKVFRETLVPGLSAKRQILR